MGELFRRFWLPALLSEEIPTPDCAPVRVKLLGEELLAFRDTRGKIGLVDAYCPHRRAELFYGRNEEGGLRCAYHGWKFDVDGKCVEMPTEPPESNFKHKIGITSYPTTERAGIVWAHLGPKERKPELPELEWMRVPQDHVYVWKWMQESNYMQGLEGEIDSSHLAFTHRRLDEEPPATTEVGVPAPMAIYNQTDTVPRFDIKEQPGGLLIGAWRNATEDTYYWRITWLFVPFYSMTPPGGARVYVPRDDESCWVFGVTYKYDRALTDKEREAWQTGKANGTPELIPGTWRTRRNKDNNFLINRELQRTTCYTGIESFREQDIALTTSMGAIVDRTKEHLGTSDTVIIEARRLLMKSARALQDGQEPYAAYHGEVYRGRGVALLLKKGVPFDEGAREFIKGRA